MSHWYCISRYPYERWIYQIAQLESVRNCILNLHEQSIDAVFTWQTRPAVILDSAPTVREQGSADFDDSANRRDMTRPGPRRFDDT